MDERGAEKAKQLLKKVGDRFEENSVYGVEISDDGIVTSNVPGLVSLLYLATDGSKKQLKSFLYPQGRCRNYILSDRLGRIRIALLANAMERALDGDVAWSKHVQELVKWNIEAHKELTEKDKTNRAVRMAKKHGKRPKSALDELSEVDSGSEEVPGE